MSASVIADICEAAIRNRDVTPLVPFMHPRIHVTSFDRSSFAGRDDVVWWVNSVFENPDITVTVIEHYIDDPVVVLVLLWCDAEHPEGVEYTAALITLDGALVRVTIDS